MPRDREHPMMHPDKEKVYALSLVVLAHLGELGGVDLPQTLLIEHATSALNTLNAKARQEVEVEARALFSWLPRAFRPPQEVPEELGTPNGDEEQGGDSDPTSKRLRLIRQSLTFGFDLDIDYYTRSRGAVSRRRITPLALEDDLYLRAYCHLRRDERVFRISRIGEMRSLR